MSWCFCGDTVHRDTSLYTYISYLHMWWFALPYFPSSGILWILAACRSNSSDGLSREMYAHICPCDCFFTECPSGCSISSILLYVLTVSCNSLFSHFVHSRVQQLTRVYHSPATLSVEFRRVLHPRHHHAQCSAAGTWFS